MLSRRSRTLIAATAGLVLAHGVAAQRAAPTPAPPVAALNSSATDSLARLRSATAKGDSATGIQLATELAAQGADSAEVRSLWTRALIHAADLDNARAVATEGLRKFPTDALSLVTMARVHLVFAEFNEAGEALSRAVQSDPGLAVAHLELGKLYEAERRMASAKKHYAIAFELAPDDPEVLLAWSATRLDISERLELLDRYVALSPAGSDYRRLLESWVAMIRGGGADARCRVRGGPRDAILKMHEIRPQPGHANRFALKLSINDGPEIRTLVDTGASGLLVSESSARKAGLEKLGLTLVRGLGQHRVREGFYARARTLEAHDLVYEDCLVEVVPDDVFANSTTEAVIGLDGFYRDFVVTFDFGSAELSLAPLPSLPGAEAGRPDRFSYDRDAAAIPPEFHAARVFGEDFVVPVLINGKVPTYFLIDSGASSTVLSKRTAEELGRIHLNSAVRVHGLSGQVPQVWTAPPIEMNVLGIGQRHQKVLAIDLDFHAAESGVGLDGMLGFSFLQHLVLTLDDRNGLVKLEIGRVTRNPALRRSIFSPL